jgi:predicted metallo-beta-lactamase superfamily hydrolase
MDVEIIGAESLGVRSMCCIVRAGSIGYLIDPGVSLAPRRFGLAPHPAEIDAARQVSARISEGSASCEIIIITHYHHDHFTPFYEHEFSRVQRSIYDGKKVYAKSWLENINRRQMDRAARFLDGLGPDRRPQICDGRETGDLVFSPAFAHGDKARGIFVVMAAIRTGSGVFVHGSDIQSVEPEAADWIIGMRPDVAFVSGPPIYLPQVSPSLKEQARHNIARMARSIPTLIVDHHLARSLDCETFLDGAARIAAAPGHRLTLASRYMNREPMLLEARRKMLYRESHDGGDGGVSNP